jgi:hypothetical protein
LEQPQDGADPGTTRVEPRPTLIQKSKSRKPEGGYRAKAIICTRGEGLAEGFLASMLAEGMPVRAKDFSQSKEDGPRMLPSM